MSCVAGLIHGGKVYIAGDSARTNPEYKTIVCCDAKVFCIGDLVLGCVGEPRFRQLLQAGFTPPLLQDLDDVYTYMVIHFIHELKAYLGAEAPKEENDFALMVGVQGRLFVVHSDYQIEESSTAYNAIGISCDLALGSLHTTKELLKDDPHQRLCLALQAACEHNAAVREPFIYVHTP